MTLPGDSPQHGRPRRRASRRARLSRSIIVVVALSVVVVGATWGWHSLRGHRTVTDSCQVIGQSTGTVYAMDPEQLLNASIIADLAMRRTLPQQAVIVAFATALQESKLRNLTYGDRDSIGLFQQRPSQGWGTKEQILVPTYAAGKFYDALLKVPSWQQLPVAEAAQHVQRSGFPDAYASWQPRATALAAALTGTSAGQLSCRLAHPGIGPGTAASNATNPGSSSSGSVGAVTTPGAASAAIKTALADDLRILSPALAPAGSKAVTVTISGLETTGAGDDAAAKHRTATVAAWAIAHAASRGITRVVVADQEWRADRFGWHTVRGAAAAPAGTVRLTVSMS
ncbi:MAG: hypothetical protein QOJ62_844 [Actinomycetota bacterium]|nr:hypothetical protein [Actinomycetota bacterium]